MDLNCRSCGPHLGSKAELQIVVVCSCVTASLFFVVVVVVVALVEEDSRRNPVMPSHDMSWYYGEDSPEINR